MLALLTSPTGTLLRDLTPFVTSCSLGTNKHGDTQISCDLAIRSLRDAFDLYEARGTPHLALVEHGIVVGEGRVEDRAIGDGTVRLTALGYQRSLSDMPYTALWSSTSVADWRPILTTEQSGNYPDRYEFDTQNRLFISPKKNETFGSSTYQGGLTFETPDGSSRTIVGISYDFALLLPTDWSYQVVTQNRDFSGRTQLYTVAASGSLITGSKNDAFTGAHRIEFSIFDAGADTAHASETGDNYLRITNLRVVTSTANRINTTLSANRAAGTNVTATVASTARMYIGQRLLISNGTGTTSETVTVLSIGSSTQFNATFVNSYVTNDVVRAHVIYANEIVSDIVTTVNALNSSQLQTSATHIASPSLDLTDESYEDQDIPELFNKLALLGDTSSRRWRWSVEHGRVVRFDYETNGTRTWYVDALSLTLEASIDALANSRYAIYKEAEGRTLRTAASTDAASVSRFGLTRRSPISASDTTSSTTAGTIRDTALADTKNPQPRVGIDFDAVYDAAGARYPLWMIRGGDTISIRNLSSAISATVDRVRSFIVDTTNYDAVARKITVTPASPLPTLDVLLARQAKGF